MAKSPTARRLYVWTVGDVMYPLDACNLSLADLAVLLARAGYDVDEYEDGGERYTVAVREKEPSDG